MHAETAILPFEQFYQRRKSFFVLMFGLAFLAVAIDVEFFNVTLPAGMREEGPWLFWLIVFAGGAAAIGGAWQLVFPPLVLAANSQGITVGPGKTSLEINLSPSLFRAKRNRSDSRFLPWSVVRAIRVGEVTYTRNGSRKSEPTLRIEFDTNIDLDHVDDMHAIRSGTAAYFAAVAEQKRNYSVTWQEPKGSPVNPNVLVIGQQHFDVAVDQVCEHLQKLAALHSSTRERDVAN